MLGLTLSLLVRLPSRELSFLVLGSDLTISLSGSLQITIVLVALVCAGMDGIVRTSPLEQGYALAYSATFWVLPTLITVLGLNLLQGVPWWNLRIALIGAAGVLLIVLIEAQCRTIDPADSRYMRARLTLNVITYCAALVLLWAVFGSRTRSVISATGAALTAGMLSLELFRSTFETLPRTWLYAAVVGLCLGELLWALNYCSVDTRTGGAILLLTFYALTGITQQYLWGRLNRRLIAEYVAVFALGLLALFGLDEWMRG
jgi:hypothetical protein